MVRPTPYTPPKTSEFECRSCLERVASEDRMTVCPECGGGMQNLSLPRE